MSELVPEPSAPQNPAPKYVVASRGKRLAASLVDGFISLIISLPVFEHFGVMDAMKNNTELPLQVSIQLMGFSLGLFFALHGYLLFRYGQTIGKRMLGIAIVHLDGQKPEFTPLILNRYLPQWVASLVPLLGPFLAIADVFYIFFNDDHRCVHDLIARTKVIDLVKSQPAATSNTMVA